MKVKMPSPSMAVATVALAISIGGGSAIAATADHGGAGQATKHGQFGHNDQYGQHRGDGGFNHGHRHHFPQGRPGSATTPVTSLSTDKTVAQGWFATGGTDGGNTTGGTATLGKQGAILGGTGAGGAFADGSEFAAIGTNAYNGLEVQDLAQLSYTASYTATATAFDNGSDAHGGAPYLRVLFADPGNTCAQPGPNGLDDVIFTANTQGLPGGPSIDLEYSGEMEHYDVTSPYGRVRVNNDAGAPPEAAGGSPWEQEIHDPVSLPGHPSIAAQPICGIVIQDGDGGNYTVGVIATVQSVTIEAAGVAPTTYMFGTSQ